MNSPLQQTLVDSLNYLTTLNREGIGPEEAEAKLRYLQQLHPRTEMDLLWDEEAYDQSVHYDLLLRLAGEGTVSLSFCPERALPWPLRGVHRWSDADLVRVNNTVLKVAEAMACLDFIWDETRIIDRLVNECLIQEALNTDPIELTDSEFHLVMDGFRRAHSLYTVQETDRWMERHGMTREKLVRLVANAARIAKLRNRLTDGCIENYFEKHRTDFDRAFIARIEFSNEQNAYQVHEQIITGQLEFYEAAQRSFLEATECSDLSHEVFAVVQRQQVALELGQAIFAATPGEVLGPMRCGEHYAVIRILSLASACLDEQTRARIKKILFEEWLAQRRHAARIQWYWGTASRTSQVT